MSRSFSKYILIIFLPLIIVGVYLLNKDSLAPPDDEKLRDEYGQDVLGDERAPRREDGQKYDELLESQGLKEDLNVRASECRQNVEHLAAVSEEDLKDPTLSVERVHDLFRAGLLSLESREAYLLLREKSERGTISIESMGDLEFLNVCQFEKVIDLVDLHLRAFKENDWGEEARQEILYIISTQMDQVVTDFYLPSNIDLVYQVLISLVDNEIVPKAELKNIEAAYFDYKTDELTTFTSLEIHGKKALTLLQNISRSYARDFY